jgi:RNA polymerase sigma-B factor
MATPNTTNDDELRRGAAVGDPTRANGVKRTFPSSPRTRTLQEMLTSQDAAIDEGLERRRSEAAKLRRFCRDRDPVLRAAIIEDHLPLARRVALRYAGGSESLDDLFQVASLGLIKAVDRYDPARGTAFSSYAVPTMSGEVRRHLRDHSWALHVPRSLQDLVLDVQGTRRELRQTLHREATVAELADALHVSSAAVTDALGAMCAREARSLDQPDLGQDGRTVNSVIDGIGRDDPGYERAEQHLLIQQLKRRLSQGELAILALRLTADLPQREIARRVGVSQMTVSRTLSGVRAVLAGLQGSAQAV